MEYPHGQGGGVKKERTFCGQKGGGGQFFSILCGCLLRTATINHINLQYYKNYRYKQYLIYIHYWKAMFALWYMYIQYTLA